MAITVNTNIASLTAQRNLTKNTNSLNQSLARLASGYKINSSKDDAAGLQIGNKLTSQIRGNNQAIQNAQDGISLLNVVEGSYTQIQNNIQRIRELTVQFANDTLGNDQRGAIQKEVFALADDITRIQDSTQFNGRKVLSVNSTQYIGCSYSTTNSEGYNYVNLLAIYAGSTAKIQVGANGSPANDTIDISTAFVTNYNYNDLQNFFPPVPSAQSSAFARAYLQTVDTYQAFYANQIAITGTLQNRLQSAVNNLTVTNENYSSARSRILDVDVAKESANLTRNQILQQASVSILSQANQQSSLALQLITR